MSLPTPENLESRFQRARNLAQRSWDRAVVYTGITLAGIGGLTVSATYIGERYPLGNTWEEIQQGQINQATEAALQAAIGPFLFELIATASTAAAVYHGYKSFRYRREANTVLREMEKRSKRPPTLGS